MGYQLSPEELNNTAERFRNDVGELERIMQDLKTSSTNLLEVWVGAGATEFSVDFDEFEKAGSTMITCLTERADALAASARLAEETESALKQQWA